MYCDLGALIQTEAPRGLSSSALAIVREPQTWLPWEVMPGTSGIPVPTLAMDTPTTLAAIFLLSNVSIRVSIMSADSPTANTTGGAMASSTMLP